ncbi:L,D-transpeptidase [Thermosynechococcus sp. CL-1]|uniref:L,D-transpeptidase n=1 Tax=unclassified Thermosynechococcus TaxID=2622553 RepID=UPI00122E691C|nr:MULTISPECIES: L,D-transpeptidase [unclassified Thermosynechococcus]QEQ01751.1 L,D-transpeptidase [Thermosynechococcus sp. CL-1]WKT83255.1 L,D-transpeptidase [Thermosynechococcus sp. HY596]WNC62384.1 L,D-transpeptidase [Thermosynechococcus sp. HY591]WNC64939.1 L,D-transpeptidase [Thermosynechococcus sp. HY593]
MKAQGFLKAGQRAIAVIGWVSLSLLGRLPFALATAPPPAVTAPLRLEISLSRRQLTLYQGQTPLRRYPVAVGRPGWETPTGQFQVREMIRDPAWKNPFTGAVIAGGHPRNPLGRRWIGFWSDGTNWVGLHGTPHPDSIGQAVSHGCVRMYNRDIEELFEKVQPGVPVIVVR